MIVKKLMPILDVISLALIVGAYAMFYFAARKLGMVRWLNSNQRAIEETIPIEVIKYVVLVLSVAVVVALAWQLLKSGRCSRLDVASIIIALAVVVVFAVVVFMATRDVTRADVFIVIMTGAASLLQVVNMVILRVKA